MNIRNATLADLPEIVTIYNSSIPSRVATADTEPVTVQQRLPWFYERDWTKRPIWVAEDGPNIAGWLAFSLFYNGRPAYNAAAEISVYISEAYRRRGFGKQLVREAIDRGPELSIKTLTAGVQSHNKPSIGLFRSFGFKRWACFPGVAELGGVERDLVILGLKLPQTEDLRKSTC